MGMRTRVKICGITRVEDALAAAQAGADAIGLVFYERSPRAVSIQVSCEICKEITPFINVVALFVNANTDYVQEVINAVPIDLLQFHGDEVAADCAQFSVPYIKAIAMDDAADVPALVHAHPSARGFLLDAYQPDTRGGGGIAFDWARVPDTCEQPLILAGGLTPENVAGAVEQARPYAVDVSSGVELEKGIKSAEKIHEFIRGVQRGDQQQESR